MLDVTKEVVNYIAAETRSIDEALQVMTELANWISTEQSRIKKEQEKKKRLAQQELEVKQHRAAAAMNDFYTSYLNLMGIPVPEEASESDFYAVLGSEMDYYCKGLAASNKRAERKAEPTRSDKGDIDAEVAAKLNEFLKQLKC